ncbi:hypothetical protein FBUS_04773 [Fasciolopsis buskii]|uniref:Receptor for retinol uptake STRA6 n=1 Tax=Fasciolopsis buskii TaxID=27845 RepID=A0A8E0VHQ7_9TREM|nr:hypothetical protein FBUS_04773 [Fasciolopsis buski]
MSNPLSFGGVLQLFQGNHSTWMNEVTPECKESQIYMRPFYNPLFAISAVYTIIVSLQTRRRSCCRRKRRRLTEFVQSPDESGVVNAQPNRSTGSCCPKYPYFHLHPGLPLPMNSIFYRHSTMAYACGYLCAFNIIGGIFTDYYGMNKTLPLAPVWFGMLYRIVAISFLSATLLPVFISITRGGFFCWTCGALYTLLESVLLLLSFARSVCLGYRAVLRQAGLQLPTLLGFLYLTFYFCQQLFLHRKAIRTDWLRYRLNKPSQYVENVAQYVQSRLRSSIERQTKSTEKVPNKSKDAKRSSCCIGLRNAFAHLFRPPLGFSYPPILIWSLAVSLLLQYFLINQSITWFHDVISQGRYTINERFPDLNKSLVENLAVSNARYVYSLFKMPKNSSSEAVLRLQFAFIYYWIDIVWVCVLSASFLALFSNTLIVFCIMLNYQTLSFTIYRGGYNAMPIMKRLLDPFKVTLGTILYPSYQISLMACGFFLQVLIYGGMFILLSVVVTMNAFTEKAFIVYFFQTSWPSVVLISIFITIQQLAIRYFFTKHCGKSYGFNNIRSLQVYAFFASFYNVIFGLISGVWRILYCPISVAVCISRLDISALGVPLQNMDTGYTAFLGFLYADTMMNNPVMKTFLWLLLHNHLADLSDDSSFDSALLVEVECFDAWLHQSTSIRLRPGLPDDGHRFSQNINFLQLARPHQGAMPSNADDNLLPSNTTYISRRSTLVRNRWLLAYSLIRNPDLKKWRRSQPAGKSSKKMNILSSSTTL